MHSIYSTISTTLKASAEALAIIQDMLLQIPFIAKWQTISCNREALVNNALIKTNQQLSIMITLLDNVSSNMIQLLKENLLLKPPAPSQLYVSMETVQLQFN